MVETRVLRDLRGFTEWLQQNRARGFIGEVGWPGGAHSADAGDWNHLAERWFAEADAASLWVTSWATGEWWPSEYRLAIYRASSGGSVDVADTHAAVVERHLGHRGRGINVAGAEFAAPATESTSEFSNDNPGAYDVAYHYDSPATFRFLANRGVRLVRLPFRWERLQPRLGQPLSKTEVRRLRAAVGAAGDAGLNVVLDMHNYGAYYAAEDGVGRRRSIGTRYCKVSHFVDVWQRLSRRFAANSSVIGYGLMNEPTGIPAAADATPAQRWERISQRVLNAIRSLGDSTMIMVPGYDWSGVEGWTENHPDGWIIDPHNRFRYEAHHYWDHDHSGTYQLSYEEEVALAGE